MVLPSRNLGSHFAHACADLALLQNGNEPHEHKNYFLSIGTARHNVYTPRQGPSRVLAAGKPCFENRHVDSDGSQVWVIVRSMTSIACPCSVRMMCPDVPRRGCCAAGLPPIGLQALRAYYAINACSRLSLEHDRASPKKYSHKIALNRKNRYRKSQEICIPHPRLDSAWLHKVGASPRVGNCQWYFLRYCGRV